MSEDSGDQRQIRIAKLAKLREAGVNPYPERFERTHSLDAARKLPADSGPIRVAGRLLTMRVMGKLSFATLQDESGTLPGLDLRRGRRGRVLQGDLEEARRPRRLHRRRGADLGDEDRRADVPRDAGDVPRQDAAPAAREVARHQRPRALPAAPLPRPRDEPRDDGPVPLPLEAHPHDARVPRIGGIHRDRDTRALDEGVRRRRAAVHRATTTHSTWKCSSGSRPRPT